MKFMQLGDPIRLPKIDILNENEKGHSFLKVQINSLSNQLRNQLRINQLRNLRNT